ncbi:MAG: DUF4430 domain-containing protein [Clostridia bacterium]|nr:DUF4430 domain-containing protein [Clostridia bacterium]
MSGKKSNKKIIAIVCVLFAVLLAASALVFHFFGPNAEQGSKEITVEIVFAQGDSKTVEIKTDAEYLRGALEEKNLVEGEDGPYGLFVTAIDGVTADSSKEQWWCFTKGGETMTTGIDSTPIKDGDKYEITLKTGYDY